MQTTNPDEIIAKIAAEDAPRPSIRDFEDFREDLERLSSPGLSNKQAKIIRKGIYDTIDARVHNGMIRAILAAVPAQPTQPQTDRNAVLEEAALACWNPPEGYRTAFDRGLGDCAESAENAHIKDAAAIRALKSAQPQQVEGSAPTDSAGSIRPSAEPAGQLDADALAMLKHALPHINPRAIDLTKARTGPIDDAYINTIARRFIETAEQTRSAARGGCSPSESVESTLSPEPAKVGGAGEREAALADRDKVPYLIVFDDHERNNELVYGGTRARYRFKEISASWNAHLFVKIAGNSHDDKSPCYSLAAKASGVQAADLAKLTKYRAIGVDGEVVKLADVEALFNPAPTGETK